MLVHRRFQVFHYNWRGLECNGRFELCLDGMRIREIWMIEGVWKGLDCDCGCGLGVWIFNDCLG